MRLCVPCWIIATSFALTVEHSTSLLVHRDQWTWTTGNTGTECSKICGNLGKTCSEAGIRTIVTPEAVIAMSRNTQYPCNRRRITKSQFPSVSPDGDCTYTWLELADNINGGNTCNVTPWVFLYRFCPCIDMHNDTSTTTLQSDPTGDPHPHTTPTPPQAAATTTTPHPASVGDPHLTNIKGETFDILREGVRQFLRFPAKEMKDQKPRLRVTASIKRAGTGTRCDSFYVFAMRISGALIGKEIAISTHGWDLSGNMAIVVQIGNQTMRNSTEIAALTPNPHYNITVNDRRSQMVSAYPHHRVKFGHLTLELAGITLEIQWSTGGRRPNALDFRATHLLNLGTNWGGLLGIDDHTWVSTRTKKCEKISHSNKQGLLIKKGAAPSFVTASLD